jgi:hypothetical protein
MARSKIMNLVYGQLNKVIIAIILDTLIYRMFSCFEQLSSGSRQTVFMTHH